MTLDQITEKFPNASHTAIHQVVKSSQIQIQKDSLIYSESLELDEFISQSSVSLRSELRQSVCNLISYQ